MHRYDWILLAIAIALVGGGLIGALTPVPMEYGLAAAFVLATPFVYDAMFRNPPLPASDFQRAAAAIIWHALLVWAVLAAI
ncbi:hypothetical protein QA600_12540 [Natronococcus sp. A-GB1]|uniref:hypothetical protein n=1 Tax=Natronococcus sp. A-GB1 TaxID=3037648 RepID=UPI00241D22A8|nr:hypothetical protein [Natronococcus sp. A-GB1]MDG5760166.1 hypothetical protein [Natronococcus sp. A-GB1]